MLSRACYIIEYQVFWGQITLILRSLVSGSRGAMYVGDKRTTVLHADMETPSHLPEILLLSSMLCLGDTGTVP